MKKNAFIFTTDAFLALPLVVLAISTFIAFSVTLRDNITIQEYTYLMARDAMNVLVDASPQNTGGSEENSFAYLIAESVSNGNIDNANQTASVIDLFFPPNAAYILEYKSSSDTQWQQIRIFDKNNKIQLNQYSIQVSNTRLITDISSSRLTPCQDCVSELVCNSNPELQYEQGTLVGPVLLRIRVFI